MRVWIMADDNREIYGTMRGEPEEPYSPRTVPRDLEADAGTYLSTWVIHVADDLGEVRPAEEFHRLLQRHLSSSNADAAAVNAE
jgi:hypothetical protein